MIFKMFVFYIVIKIFGRKDWHRSLMQLIFRQEILPSCYLCDIIFDISSNATCLISTTLILKTLGFDNL